MCQRVGSKRWLFGHSNNRACVYCLLNSQYPSLDYLSWHLSTFLPVCQTIAGGKQSFRSVFIYKWSLFRSPPFSPSPLPSCPIRPSPPHSGWLLFCLPWLATFCVCLPQMDLTHTHIWLNFPMLIDFMCFSTILKSLQRCPNASSTN